MGKGHVETDLIQIINKPDQIVALKGWYTLLKLLPIQYVAELTVELAARSVEVMEFLQGGKVE